MEAKINNFIEQYAKNYNKIRNKDNITAKINMLKLIKTSIVIQQTDVIQLYIERVLNEHFIGSLLLLLLEHKSCTIAHNLVKDMFIIAINKNYDYFVPTLLIKTKFCEMFSNIEGKSNSI
jgi:hypothetical protein